MYSFIALALGLTIAADVREPTLLYQDSGTMVPGDHSQLISNFYVSKDVPVKLEAKGNGRGDLDCYLLKFSDTLHGWVIVNKDESNIDQCSVAYTPSIAQPMRLWVVNHGVHPTTFTVTVKQ
jgi:hypothetical protein